MRKTFKIIVKGTVITIAAVLAFMWALTETTLRAVLKTLPFVLALLFIVWILSLATGKDVFAVPHNSNNNSIQFTEVTASAIADNTAINPSLPSPVGDGNGGFLPQGFTNTFAGVEMSGVVNNGAITSQSFTATASGVSFAYGTVPVSASLELNTTGRGLNHTAEMEASGGFTGDSGWAQSFTYGNISTTMTESIATVNAGAFASGVGGNASSAFAASALNVMQQGR